MNLPWRGVLPSSSMVTTRWPAAKLGDAGASTSMLSGAGGAGAGAGTSSGLIAPASTLNASEAASLNNLSASSTLPSNPGGMPSSSSASFDVVILPSSGL